MVQERRPHMKCFDLSMYKWQLSPFYNVFPFSYKFSSHYDSQGTLKSKYIGIKIHLDAYESIIKMILVDANRNIN